MITGLLAKFGGSALKYGAIALLLIGLIVGALWYVDSVRKAGYQAGKTETEAQVQTNTIIIQKEITRAEKAAPRTPRAVADSLRSGTF